MFRRDSLKFVCFILLIFGTSDYINAQKLSADDLVYCIKSDLDKFDTFVASKGFSLYKVQNNIYVYSYINGNKYLGYYSEPTSEYTKQIYYQTLDSKEYASFKRRLIILGYKLDVTQLSPNLSFYYVKGKHWIEITSTKGAQ